MLYGGARVKVVALVGFWMNQFLTHLADIVFMHRINAVDALIIMLFGHIIFI